MSIRVCSLASFLSLLGVVACGALAAGPASAVAPAAGVLSEAPSEITASTAILHGTVVPEGSEAGSDTRWCFEYGPIATSGYGLGSLPALAGDAGRGTAAVAVSVQLTGLTPGSTYHYRLVAVNALGEGLSSSACGTAGGQETDGAEIVFTTPGALLAPIATTGAAGSITANTATITGVAETQGLPGTYELQIGVDTSYGIEIFGPLADSTQPQPITLALTYLEPGTTYHYRLVAIDHAATSYGADQAFTTPTVPTATLAPPAASPLVPTPTVAFPTTTLVSNPKMTRHIKKSKAAHKPHSRRRRAKQATQKGRHKR